MLATGGGVRKEIASGLALGHAWVAGLVRVLVAGQFARKFTVRT